MRWNWKAYKSRCLAPLCKWLATVLLLVASSCRPTLVDFYVPEHVDSGGEFEVHVAANLPQDLSAQGYAAGCVLQLPVGVTVLGYSFAERDTSYYSFAGRIVRDDPGLLAFYTAEPGHVLASFHATHPTNGHVYVPGFGLLRLRLRVAGTVSGSVAIKLALAGGDVGAWTAEQPAGVRQFAAITTAPFARNLQVGGRATVDFHLQSSTSFPAASAPTRAGAVDVADVDGDGFQDLVGGWHTPLGDVFECHRFQPGAGWALYGPSVPFVFGSLSSAGVAAVGDFDGDGIPDFVRADGQTYFGGGGTFTSGQLLVGIYSRAPLVGDTNHDGFDDLVTIGVSSDLHLYRGSSSRAFTEPVVGLPTAVSSYGRPVLADLNGDGHLDLYVPRDGASNVFVGDGLGGFVAGTGVDPLSRAGLAADLDGDGIAELVTYSANSVSFPDTLGVRVHRSIGPTQWSLVQGTGLPSQGEVTSCALLDVNGDGALDVAVGGWAVDAPGVTIFENLGNGTFAPRANTGLPSSGGILRISTGDYTNDGAPDLLVCDRSGQVTFYASTRGPAAYRPLGPGCAGAAGTATNRSSELPRIGRTPVLTFAPLSTPCAGVLLIGSSATNSATLGTLPFDLAPHGAPGCLLRVDGGVAQFFGFGSGSLGFPVSIPSVPAFVGVSLYTQGVILDNANAFGLVTTQASVMTIGG